MRAEINAQSKHRVVSPSRIVCVSFAAIRSLIIWHFWHFFFLINDRRESFRQREIRQLFNSLWRENPLEIIVQTVFQGKSVQSRSASLNWGSGGGFIHCWLWTERFFTAALDRRRFPITRFQTIKFDLSATDEVKEFYYYWKNFTSSAFIFEHPPTLGQKSLLRNVWGWVQSSKLRCPLTVRLTSRLLEVIDWVVLGPPRTLSAALEVRGHLLCKSASFCTVATPGRAVSHHPLLFPPPPSLLPLVFTLGKWGRRQLNLFSLSLQFSLSSEVAL